MSYAVENALRTHARELRIRRGQSQIDLASRSGVALETIRKLERGEVVGMKIETLLRISAALEAIPSEVLPVLAECVSEGAGPPRRRRVDPRIRVRRRQSASQAARQ
jgi:transcriptional regulator with XRE-family HTH domain